MPEAEDPAEQAEDPIPGQYSREQRYHHAEMREALEDLKSHTLPRRLRRAAQEARAARLAAEQPAAQDRSDLPENPEA